jgi:sugar (pentulose or hexulose) kinase
MPIAGQHPAPGLWEQEAEQVWQAASFGMRRLMANDALRRDPPKAIAVSASGRENFLADAEGRPLALGVMGADVRGAEFDTSPDNAELPEAWCLSCGHLRERMDPVFRLSWWRKYHPEIVAKARYFLGWHDFLILRLCGRIVQDRSTASRYLVYDLRSNAWSTERVAEYRLEPDFLPEILPWPAVIGQVSPEVAAAWELPSGTQVALGGHDVTCAAVGAGVSGKGVACLISGSYENLMVMTGAPPSAAMLLRGLSVMPHPGQAGYAALAVCPTGSAVLNWARDLLGTSIEELDSYLDRRAGPSPVLAVPYLSGSPRLKWPRPLRQREGSFRLRTARPGRAALQPAT